MTLSERLLMEYGALVGALMLLASLRRKPPDLPSDLKPPYALIAAAGLIMCVQNHLELNLSPAEAAGPVIGLSALSTVALVEAAILMFFGIATPPVALANRVGKYGIYAAKGIIMALLGGSTSYLAIAQQMDTGTSLVGASMISVAIATRLVRKPLVPMLVLGACLIAFSLLQNGYYSHGFLEKDVMHLAFLGAAALLSVL